MSLSLDANDVPIIYRIKVTDAGEVIFETTRYLNQEDIKGVRMALSNAYPDSVIDIYPA